MNYNDQEDDGGFGWKLLDRMHSIISSSDGTDTPSYINEDNTSIFLNAMTGMFFPSCHTHVEPIGYDLAGADPDTFYNRNKERLEKLIKWQTKIYQRQVFVFNVVLMVVMIVIFILVSFVKSFNYHTNVMNSFWFSMSMALLLVSGIISILTTAALNMDNIGRKVTQESCFYGSADEVQEETFSKTRLCLNTIFCLVLSVLVFLPVIAGLVLYSVVRQTEPYVFLINHNETNSEKVDFSILTAFPIHIPGSQDLGTTNGTIDLDCYIVLQSKFMGKMG